MYNITINGNTELYGIIGNPVSHSFSPAMQTTAFQKSKINAVYLPFQVKEEDLPKLLDALSLLKVKGFNVTVPFKEKIVPFLDELSFEAEVLRSVNTVKSTKNGWKGYSTDGSGFVKSLMESGFDLKDKSVLIVGAGGSAKSITLSLGKAKVKELNIINRTASKAESIKKSLSLVNSSLKVTVNPPIDKTYDLLVNCTSVGMKDEVSPVADEIIKKCQRVIDIIYNPPKTLLMKKAADLSIKAENGLGMLLHQGTEAFRIWTDKEAPVQFMKDSLLKSLDG